jgi:tRNA modification GTPase
MDSIEQIGVSKSKEKMRSAQVVLYLFDVQEMEPAELTTIVNEFKAEQISYMLIGNKSEADNNAARSKFSAFSDCIFISAKDNLNIDQLKKLLVQKTIMGDIYTESTIVTNARHHQALLQLAASLQEVSEGLDNRIPGDLLALDIRECLHHLGTITGQITHEDQLDFIFSKFCIGK